MLSIEAARANASRPEDLLFREEIWGGQAYHHKAYGVVLKLLHLVTEGITIKA